MLLMLCMSPNIQMNPCGVRRVREEVHEEVCDVKGGEGVAPEVCRHSRVAEDGRGRLKPSCGAAECVQFTLLGSCALKRRRPYYLVSEKLLQNKNQQGVHGSEHSRLGTRYIAFLV